MKAQARHLTIALLLATLATPALAGPPGGHGEGRSGGPGAAAWGPHGPRHGHGLPDFAREVWIGSTLYFLAAGTYFLWSADRQRYVEVQPPPAVPSLPANSYEVIAYPSTGQDQDRQARDRYECHRWAVQQSGFDPSTARQAPAAGSSDYYRRALGACLSGRGYSIN